MPEFLPSLPVLAAFAFASAVLALTPGPDMTLFLSKTVSQSRTAGIAAFAGATSGLVIHSCLAAIGLSALLAASATAFTVLKIAGAAYLAWLAVDAIRNGSSFALTREAERERIGTVYLKGLAIDLLNPKVIVFFVTFLPQFVSPDDPHPAAKLLFLGLIFVVVSIPTCLPLIFFADRIAGWLKRSRWATRAVDYLFATVLGAFAVRLLFSERN
jgi:threonine/homoserine/homoserine lactone efflux protein